MRKNKSRYIVVLLIGFGLGVIAPTVYNHAKYYKYTKYTPEQAAKEISNKLDQ